MKKIKYMLSACLASLILVACQSEDISPSKARENATHSFVASLAMDISVDDEIGVIGLNTDQPKAASVHLERDNQARKFRAKLFPARSGETIPITFELHGYGHYMVSTVNAKVLSEKKIRIEAKDIQFYVPEMNTEGDFVGDFGAPWKARIIVGGTYDKGRHSVKFDEYKGLIVDETQGLLGHLGDIDRLSTYAGKIPFVSDWTDIQFETKNNKTTFFLKDGKVDRAIKIKPRGNILRLHFRNPDANLTYASQNISRILFESDDVVSRGEVALGSRRIGERYVWNALGGTMQKVELHMPQHSYIPVQPAQAAIVYLWVDQPSSYNPQARTKIIVDVAKNGYPTYNNVLMNKVGESAHIPSGKSSPIYLTLPH